MTSGTQEYDFQGSLVTLGLEGIFESNIGDVIVGGAYKRQWTTRVPIY